MDNLRLKHLAKTLLDRCGGADAVIAARISDRIRDRAQLYRYASPTSPGCYMPADIIAALEAYCGEAIFSAALAQAATPAAAEAVSLLDEGFDINRDGARLLELIRRFSAHHQLSVNNRIRLEGLLVELETHVRACRAAAEGPSLVRGGRS